MKIDRDTLFLIAPEGTAGRYGFPLATMTMHRFFCGPMTVRGICTGSCLMQCTESINQIFHYDEENPPENKAALATWVAKQELARQQEIANQHEATRQVDEFGIPTSESNAFDQFLRTL